jgi:diguanylate cyclase (GGDEF)-like protein
LAERIRIAISNLVFDAGGARLHITVSLGIAELGDREETLPDLIKKADQALYMAKNKGRNRTELR